MLFVEIKVHIVQEQPAKCFGSMRSDKFWLLRLVSTAMFGYSPNLAKEQAKCDCGDGR